MTTEELGDKLADVFGNVLVRVEGIGDHNYRQTFGDGSERQAFEDKPLCDILTDTLEEVQDAMAYLAFLHIRIEQLLKGISK